MGDTLQGNDILPGQKLETSSTQICEGDLWKTQEYGTLTLEHNFHPSDWHTMEYIMECIY